MLPNIIEEVAFLYNRRLLDRGVASEILGVDVESLWIVGQPLIKGERGFRERPSIYCEWEEMQEDTPRQRLKETRIGRRRLTR